MGCEMAWDGRLNCRFWSLFLQVQFFEISIFPYRRPLHQCSTDVRDSHFSNLDLLRLIKSPVNSGATLLAY